MMEERNEEIGGKMELRHEPVSPYRTVFFIAISIGVLYLAIILMVSIF